MQVVTQNFAFKVHSSINVFDCVNLLNYIVCLGNESCFKEEADEAGGIFA